MYLLQWLTVVILEHPQMANALSPVQPTMLECSTLVTKGTHCRVNRLESVGPLDCGVNVYLCALVVS